MRQFPEYAQAPGATLRATTLAELRKDCIAYLVNLDDGEPQAIQAHVEHDFLFFFKRELELWEPQTEGYWPEPLTLALFRQWFEVESFDMVLDTVGDYSFWQRIIVTEKRGSLGLARVCGGFGGWRVFHCLWQKTSGNGVFLVPNGKKVIRNGFGGAT